LEPKTRWSFSHESFALAGRRAAGIVRRRDGVNLPTLPVFSGMKDTMACAKPCQLV